jgi:hypothetical protein
MEDERSFMRGSASGVRSVAGWLCFFVRCVVFRPAGGTSAVYSRQSHVGAYGHWCYSPVTVPCLASLGNRHLPIARWSPCCAFTSSLRCPHDCHLFARSEITEPQWTKNLHRVSHVSRDTYREFVFKKQTASTAVC